jgi:Zn-dependent peptidase ImmA (M78 family)/transcriptional regulator with XRE-family HTH domain
MKSFNSGMLLLAREARGFTQSDLQERSGISQANISKYESGQMDPSDEYVARLAEALGYPQGFFFEREAAYVDASSCLFTRKNSHAGARRLRELLAKLGILRIQLTKLLDGVDIDTGNRFVRGSYHSHGSPGHVARLIRDNWKLPRGQVPSVTKAIEQCGGLVVPCDFQTDDVFAVSQWPPNLRPLFFVNTRQSGDRYRFTLAHELGHTMLHSSTFPGIEFEADQFAAEFLMPGLEIKSQLMNPTFQKLVDLKRMWGVSISALIRRAYDLDVISESRYRKFNMEIRAYGYHRSEPVGIEREEPSLLNKIIAIYRNDYGLTISELSNLVSLNEHDFIWQYLPNMRKLVVAR